LLAETSAHMNKAIFTVLAITFLLAACKKTTTTDIPTGNAGGTWTFKGITYQAPVCDTTSGNLVATVPTAKGQHAGGEMAVDFYTATPNAAGTYSVIRGSYTINNATQVEVGITDINGVYYISTGNDNATVAASINNGKVSLSGTNIELVNLNNAADSSTLTFAINQTN
jgi:hypothetical protein